MSPRLGPCTVVCNWVFLHYFVNETQHHSADYYSLLKRKERKMLLVDSNLNSGFKERQERTQPESIICGEKFADESKKQSMASARGRWRVTWLLGSCIQGSQREIGWGRLAESINGLWDATRFFLFLQKVTATLFHIKIAARLLYLNG